MEIKACPRCGSTNIYQGTIGDGVLTGYTNRDVCKNCGFQGMPVIFNSEEDYKKFLNGLKKDKSIKNVK
jgi:rRNA maturation protein Nop10